MQQPPAPTKPDMDSVIRRLVGFGLGIIPADVAKELHGLVMNLSAAEHRKATEMALAAGAGLIAQRIVRVVQNQLGPPPADGSAPPPPPQWAIAILAELGSSIDVPKTGPVESREELHARAKAAGLVIV